MKETPSGGLDLPALETAAQAVLDHLHGADLEQVLAKFHSSRELLDAMCRCAADVVAACSVPVAVGGYELLLAATLTRGPQRAGVHVNTANAVKRYELLTRRGDLPPHLAVLVTDGDDDLTVERLVLTDRVDAEVAAERGEPPAFRTMVTAAVVVTTPERPRLAEDVITVLERGAELAARFRASGRPLPGTSLKVLGNTDFLLTLAGYQRALREHRSGAPPGDPLAEIEKTLPALEESLRQAMTRSAHHLLRGGVDEPDIVGFFLTAAKLLPGDATGDAVRQVVARVSRVLNRMQLRRDERALPVEPTMLPEDRPEPVDGMLDVHQLASRTVEALIDGTTGSERASVADWLMGERPADTTDDLLLLLSRLRRAMAALTVRPVHDYDVPPPPGTVRARLEETLRQRIVDVPGSGDAAVTAVAAALPPLWTRRSPVLAALHRLAILDTGRGPSQRATALLLAAAAVRGPGQIARAGGQAQHPDEASCILVGDETPRCVARHAAAATPPATKVCPARPWGEVGYVDSWQTLADLTGIETPGAVRKRLERYKGDWLNLVLLGMP